MNYSIQQIHSQKKQSMGGALILFIAMTFSSVLSSAQWVRSDNGIAGGNISALAVNGTTIFAGLNAFEGGLNQSGVFISTNNGTTWAPVNTSTNTGIINVSDINCLLVNGTNLFAGGVGGLYRSGDNGATWTLANTGITNSFIVSLAAIGTNLFAATQAGVFLSTNNGANWTTVNTGLTNINVLSLGVSGANLFAGTSGGVFLSTNNGSSWASANLGITGTVESFALIGANLFAGTQSNGVFLSTNNGTSWTSVSSGLTNGQINSLLATPSADLYAGTNGGGVFRSTNFGTTWASANSGLSNSNVNALAVNGSNIFAGTPSGVFLSPNSGSSWTMASTGINTIVNAYAVSGINTFVGVNGGVFLSSDNGTNWTGVNTGLTNNDVLSLTLSGSNMFTGTNGDGVFLSTNNGTSWTAVNTGLSSLVVKSLASSGTNIFAGTTGGGIFLSTNNGASWAAVNTGISSLNVTSLYANGSNIFAGTQGAGVFLSTTNGTGWTSINTGVTANVSSFVASGTNLFISTRGGGVFISANNGTGWTAVTNGLVSTQIYSLALGGTAIFAGASNGVFVSTNNGTDWVDANAGLTGIIGITALGVSGTKLFAGRTFGSLWARSLVEFVPAISSFSPISGPIGTVVTITGTGFSTTPADNTVSFNGTTATVTASTATSITTTVPAGGTSGTITVTVNTLTATSASSFTVFIPPTIASFAPASGPVGTTVAITGTNFSTTPANNTVSFNGTSSIVTASTATSITTTVPAGATTGTISVTVNSLTATSASNYTVTVPPTITSFTPASGPVGTTVTITGTNFSTTAANNTVNFNGTAATVTAATATSITTTVPVAATTGTISVTANALTAISATNFTLPDTTKPVVANTTNGTIAQGSTIILAATLTDAESGITGANVLYRFISAGGNFLSTPLTKGAGQDYSFTLPTGATGELGVEYKFEVTNGVGLINDPILYTIRVTFPGSGLVIPYTAAGIEVSNYRIVAVPLVLTAKSVGDVFDELGSLDETTWRMSHYQNGTNPDLNLSSSIEPGLGYWLIAKEDPGAINSGAGITVMASTNSPFQINLVAGWNQIGNPYNYNISWPDVQAANSSLPGLRKYDGTFIDATVLNAMEGGFVNVPSAGKIVIPVTKNNSANGGRMAQDNLSYKNSLSEKNWQVYLQLNQGYYQNKIAGFGMNEKASELFDPFDGLTMPRFFSTWLEVNHTKKNQDGFYSKDIVPTSENHVWEFSIESSEDNPAMAFIWDNTYFGAGGPELYLWDRALQLSINMRETNHYTFNKERQGTFNVVYGSPEFVKSETMIDNIVFHDAWPNPAREGEDVTVSFSLPGSAAGEPVSISAIDLLGRKVWSDEASYSSGFHKVNWRRTGKEITGLYIITLKVGNAKKQMRVVLR